VVFRFDHGEEIDVDGNCRIQGRRALGSAPYRRPSLSNPG